MTTVKDIWEAVDRAAPFASAMEFDNVGLLTGSMEAEVHRALLALDITQEVVREAEMLGAQLILSHHPVIFHPFRAVEEASPVAALIRAGIAAIGCHTNLDIADEIGVNAALCGAVGLRDVRRASEAVLIGHVEEMSLLEFARLVKERLGCSRVEVTPIEARVKEVAVCSGAGGGFLSGLKGKCDVYLTGELRHDELVYALDQALPVVAAGHYHTERLFAPALKRYLQGELPQVEFVISRTERCPVVTV